MSVSQDLLVGGRIVTDEEYAAADGFIRIAVLDKTGDSKRIWDPKNAEEVEDARESYARLKGKGHAIYRVDPATGAKTELMPAFEPEAAKFLATPRMQGG